MDIKRGLLDCDALMACIMISILESMRRLSRTRR